MGKHFLLQRPAHQAEEPSPQPMTADDVKCRTMFVRLPIFSIALLLLPPAFSTYDEQRGRDGLRYPTFLRKPICDSRLADFPCRRQLLNDGGDITGVGAK
jgi:hypothetical protein